MSRFQPIPLNLPPTELDIKICQDGIERVFDPLRQKFVALTPEEWVRQHFIAYLIDDLGYPQSLMANEVPLKLNGTSRRADTVLFSKEGMTPQMIIEYKAPDVEITQCVFDQIARYNIVLKAPYLIVSNGYNHYCCKLDYSNKSVEFLHSIPSYLQLIDKL